MKKFNEEIELIKTKGHVWYAKWFSTIVVIIAVGCRSIEEIPKSYDVFLSLIGTFGWLYVGLQWKDRSLIVLNSVLVFMLATSALRYILS